MTFKLKDCKQIVFSSDVKKFEEMHNVSLPEEYKKFLLKNNGGKPVAEDAFHYESELETYSDSAVRYFFSLFSDNNSVEYNFEIYVLAKRIPSSMLPIAADYAGNVVCISISNDTFGKIYFWDHEEELEDDDNNPSHDNLYLIADSFTEFLGSLK